MKKLIVYQIDSFTKGKFKGNPAGVVVNADGLSVEEMQSIARELNNSETAFLFEPNTEDQNLDGKIRYFTPSTEVPLCGHATIAAMYAKAREENLDSCVLNIETQIGVLPFEIIKKEDDYQIVMTQGKFELSPPLSTDIVNEIISALGLNKVDLDQKCPVQIASAGHSKVMIGIKHRELLNKLTPNFSRLAELSEEIKCNGYFVFTFDSDDKNILTYGRMFAPALGINEDPVTGNANGPLGGYLVENKLVSFQGGNVNFKARQGEIMGRLGTVKVNVDVENNHPAVIKIQGSAVTIFKTQIEV